MLTYIFSHLKINLFKFRFLEFKNTFKDHIFKFFKLFVLLIG